MRSSRAFLAVSLATGLLFGATALPLLAQNGGPPPGVAVAPAVARKVQDVEEFNGRLESPETVEIRPRVSGVVERVHFREGAIVRAGDLLFTIDRNPFEAEVQRAEAQVAVAESQDELARSELERARRLLDARAVSRQEYDQLTSGKRVSDANIRAARANLRVARLNLGYTQVRAPITGRVSRALITAGNLVDDKTILTTLVSTSKVYAYFEGSEQTFLRLRGTPPDQMTVRMALADETGLPHSGRIDFVDNRLDPQTGTIRMRAVFDNADGRFAPGLYARMVLSGGGEREAVLTPDRAIGTDQTKKFVLVATPQNVAEFREVKTGALYDGMRVILSGLKAGELVIVSGLQRVRPGSPLTAEKLQVDERGMPVEKPTGAPARKP